LDPLNPNERLYISVDINRALSDPASADNFVLEPFDSLHIYSKNDFLEEVYVQVDGAVNNPGSFSYGDSLTLRDALILAGGFKISSATNNIEIARVIIEDNKPTRTIVKKVSMTREELYNSTFTNEEIKLAPHDQIFVRYVPEFELQQNVMIEGEVTNPGVYSLIEPNEKVFDLVYRAGGLSEAAFSQAATLYRSQDSLGAIVIKLDEVLSNPSSKYNYVLVEGDRLTIPKRKEIVTIVGATQFLAQNPEQKSINVPYSKGKSARYYIDNYAGGFADDARKDKIFVLYPNGGVSATIKKFPFGRKHPDVLPGSEIQVGFMLKEKAGEEKENVNWTKVFGDSVAQAMSILTLVLLVQRLD
jgi:protein involved in polysaccharide export with SLBB domain